MKKILFRSLLAVVIVAPAFASAPQSSPATSSKEARPFSSLHDRQKELEEFRLQMKADAEQKRKDTDQIQADALGAQLIAEDLKTNPFGEVFSPDPSLSFSEKLRLLVEFEKNRRIQKEAQANKQNK